MRTGCLDVSNTISMAFFTNLIWLSSETPDVDERRLSSFRTSRYLYSRSLRHLIWFVASNLFFHKHCLQIRIWLSKHFESFDRYASIYHFPRYQNSQEDSTRWYEGLCRWLWWKMWFMNLWVMASKTQISILFQYFKKYVLFQNETVLVVLFAAEWCVNYYYEARMEAPSLWHFRNFR